MRLYLGQSVTTVVSQGNTEVENTFCARCKMSSQSFPEIAWKHAAFHFSVSTHLETKPTFKALFWCWSLRSCDQLLSPVLQSGLVPNNSLCFPECSLLILIRIYRIKGMYLLGPNFPVLHSCSKHTWLKPPHPVLIHKIPCSVNCITVISATLPFISFRGN